jgi:hypothetical protein
MTSNARTRAAVHFPSPPPLRGRGQRPALSPAEGEGQPLAPAPIPLPRARLGKLAVEAIPVLPPLTVTLSPEFGGEGIAAGGQRARRRLARPGLRQRPRDRGVLGAMTFVSPIEARARALFPPAALGAPFGVVSHCTTPPRRVPGNRRALARRLSGVLTVVCVARSRTTATGKDPGSRAEYPLPHRLSVRRRAWPGTRGDGSLHDIDDGSLLMLSPDAIRPAPSSASPEIGAPLRCDCPPFAERVRQLFVRHSMLPHSRCHPRAWPEDPWLSRRRFMRRRPWMQQVTVATCKLVARWVLGTRPRMTPVLLPPLTLTLSPEAGGEGIAARTTPCSP